VPNGTRTTAAPAVPRTATRNARMASIAMRVPDRVVGNEEIAERIGVSGDWIVSRTGVRERRHAAPEERLDELAAAAGRDALARAEVDPADLDLVLVATMAPDDLSPNAAPLVAELLGAHRAGAFDVGAACTGFISSLSVAAAQVESGRADAALVVGADLLSRITDREDRSTAGLFADGAGAAVIAPGRDGEGAIGPIVLGADGSGAPTIRATFAERKLRMQGHDTFRQAVRRLSESTVAAVERAGLGLDEIDLFVYHQANTRILSAVGERLELDPARVIDCIERYGNTSSATVPIALVEAEAAGRLEPGAKVLLAAFGAGFTWGAGVVEWG
jgi:3-oxoacyl-[acyl-carrier-protein] synthase III